MNFPNLFNLFPKKQNSTDIKSFIKLFFDKEGNVRIQTLCAENEEERYAEMVYILSSTKVCETILGLLRADPGKANVDKIQSHIDSINKQVKIISNELNDGPVVRPSQVFK